MLDSLAKVWAAGKEGALEAAVKAFLNREFEKFGSINSLRLDSKQKTITAELALKGETSPLTVHVESYRIEEKDGVTYLTVQSARASREWVSAALDQFLVGRPIKVPAVARMAL